MLEKLVLFVVTLLVTVTSSFAPAGFFVATSGDASVSTSSADALLFARPTEFHLTTVDDSGLIPFARLSVLSVSVNGERLTEDEMGNGYIAEMRFQVGVKRAEATGIRMGDSVIPVHPTDNFTIRGFNGRYQILNLQGGLTTLSLEGTVQVTAVNEGVLKGLQTLAEPAKPGASENLAYVIIEGARNEAVSLTHGPARRAFTTSETAPGGLVPGHLLVRAVRINGNLVVDNAWGDGTLDEVSFDVVAPDGANVTVHFNGKDLTMRPGERVEVRRFLGTYVAYPVSGGLHKLKLDGVAESINVNVTRLAADTLSPFNTVPSANATHFPLNPTTSTLVSFSDNSVDTDGVIPYRRWDFGDNSGGSSDAFPRHRFAQPGVYRVRLEVTDNALGVNSTTIEVVVDNSPPQSDFNWFPKDPTTFFDIPFQDLSKDVDGKVVSWSWSFGDGGTSALRNPSHSYLLPGAYNVTLLTTDDEGATNATTKVVLVQNSPPRANFQWVPDPPIATEAVLFYDTSSDLDGLVVESIWNFPGSAPVTGLNATFVFPRAGSYEVSHTVIDDAGEASTVRKTVSVLNHRPTANFTYTPTELKAGRDITFLDRSTDRDGAIVARAWDFGDGGTSTDQSPVRHYTSGGNFTVRLTVTDNDGGKDTIEDDVSVDGASPLADFSFFPRVARTGDRVNFVDSSTDLDGDVVEWYWEFGDGSNQTVASPFHIYRDNCTCTVNLTVKDNDGRTDTVRRQVEVLNRPPSVVSFSITPTTPLVGDIVTFNASVADSDGFIIATRWDFGDGTFVAAPNATHVYTRSGNYQVRLITTDDDHVTSTTTIPLTVAKRPPTANFTWSPEVPLPDTVVAFTDATQYREDVGTSWSWDFGDGSPTTGTRNATHRFGRAGTFTVTYNVTDAAGLTSSVSREVRVNSPPNPTFTWRPTNPEPGVPIQFTDASTDDSNVSAWSWSFNDEDSSTVQNPLYTFNTSGPKTVRLTVTDDDGATRTRTVVVFVVNQPPTADYTVAPMVVVQNEPATFTDRSTDASGVITGWTWDFGDGSQPMFQQNVTHTFVEPGRWRVVLTVQDAEGRAASTNKPPLRVVGDHPYELNITPVLPDGSPVSLLQGNVQMTVRNTHTNLPLTPSNGITIHANGTATALFPAKTWAPGDGFLVDIRVGNYEATGQVEGDFIAYRNPQDVLVPLTAPIRLGLEVVPSQSLGIVAQQLDGTPEQNVFTDPMETVKVLGRVTWANGDPVRNARISLTSTWTVTESRAAALGVAYSVLTTNADPATTDADGYALITVPRPYPDPLVEGPYLPGWYEVTGRAFLSVSLLATFDPTTAPVAKFFEDPEGALTPLDVRFP